MTEQILAEILKKAHEDWQDDAGDPRLNAWEYQAKVVIARLAVADQGQKDQTGLVARITDYLTGGGLFNPEMAMHERVRDLLIDCREALRAGGSPARSVPIDIEDFDVWQDEHHHVTADKQTYQMLRDIAVNFANSQLKLRASDPQKGQGWDELKDESRCAVCAWPLAESAEKGCVRGNCSQRPFPEVFYDLDRANREYGNKLGVPARSPARSPAPPSVPAGPQEEKK